MHKIKEENPVNIRYDCLLRSRTIEKKISEAEEIKSTHCYDRIAEWMQREFFISALLNLITLKKEKRGSFKIDSPHAGSFPHFYLQNTIAHMCFTSRTLDNLLVRSLLIFLCLALSALFLYAEEYSLYILWQMATAFAVFDFFYRSLVDIYASPYCRYR